MASKKTVRKTAARPAGKTQALSGAPGPFARSADEFPGRPFVHPMAVVEGMTTLGEGCSVWGGAVLRADMNEIQLGRFVNIQDNTTLHTDSRSRIDIGDYSLIGHNVMLHGCRLGRAVMIGIGSVVLDGAEIGDGAMVTAGCMIRGGRKIPPRALVIQRGNELKIVEHAAKTALIVAGSLEYVELARRRLAGSYGPFSRQQELDFLAKARDLIEQMGI